MTSENLIEEYAGFDNGVPLVREKLLETVYQELRSLAKNYLRQERADHTLQPTALVHEAYLRLSEQENIVWKSREHFIGVAAIMMRRVLVNYAVSRKREKRGGGELRLPISEANNFATSGDISFMVLDEALVKLEKEHAAECRIVELKYFGGLSTVDVARVLGISERTVERRWRFARTWLLRELSE